MRGDDGGGDGRLGRAVFDSSFAFFGWRSPDDGLSALASAGLATSGASACAVNASKAKVAERIHGSSVCEPQAMT